ncbi:hypothetical protein K469DRAFT_701115 [Zopfia rhizophila CBS 207.26]|uniref:ORC6 first cyclin-like domain-containing protein n=1 Tax=Zopfia rhizophila CBS 207.26 TaxID=1314779 RepID=A0A6A6EFJ6_9PEZI|nr:hypothetical protein K469DRAFT_701115 [Zopfia rhizophila CBS 207.26]
MSRATIEQALTGLIPTLNGPLPPELVDLAVSLLARSGSVASSLKQDEEIARPYACAQLACERLKKHFNLPAITSRPPCPARIYKKLYKYLDSALPASTTREPQTPRKVATQATTSTRTTPKTPKTPLSALKTPRSAGKDAAKGLDPPDWAMPTIREVCRAFAYPTAAPHVYTGLESILPLLARMSAPMAETPSKRSRRAITTSQASAQDVSDTCILSLIAISLFYVLSRMMDQEITPEQFLQWRDKAVSTLLRSIAGKECTEEGILENIEQLMPMAQEEGWLRMEWFLNVFPDKDVDEMEGVETTDGDGAILNSHGRGLRDAGNDCIGLGTMMQEATDYLGERQRADYVRWKARIMARVEEIEAS